MRVGWESGYYEMYWGDWLTARQLGGSERIVVRVAEELAAQGHSVSVRLPYDTDERVRNGVRWRGLHSGAEQFDILFLADCFDRRDNGVRTCLVANRSDPPPHKDFDQRIYLSRTHAELMGDPSAPYVGGGVGLADYAVPKPRIPRRVICTSSPDRCPQASPIGRSFDFRHTYKPVGNVGHEYTREEVIDLQRTAQVHIYPLDPRRPSDFFSMSVLESLCAGTPVIVSDADSMRELWSDAALVLPRPIDLGEWYATVEQLLSRPKWWAKWSALGQAKAKEYEWPKQAQRYLALALGSAT